MNLDLNDADSKIHQFELFQLDMTRLAPESTKSDCLKNNSRYTCISFNFLLCAAMHPMNASSTKKSLYSHSKQYNFQDYLQSKISSAQLYLRIHLLLFHGLDIFSPQKHRLNSYSTLIPYNLLLFIACKRSYNNFW